MIPVPERWSPVASISARARAYTNKRYGHARCCKSTTAAAGYPLVTQERQIPQLSIAVRRATRASCGVHVHAVFMFLSEGRSDAMIQHVLWLQRANCSPGSVVP